MIDMYGNTGRSGTPPGPSMAHANAAAALLKARNDCDYLRQRLQRAEEALIDADRLEQEAWDGLCAHRHNELRKGIR